MAYSDDNFIPESVSPRLAPAAVAESVYPVPDRIRILRCLDGIFYSLCLTVLFLLLCRFRLLLSRNQADLLILPLLVICIATLRLPWPANPAPQMEQTLFKLKAAGLILTGLMPFTLWWLRTPDTAYLTTGGSLAILSGAWYLMEITAYLGGLLRLWNYPVLERKAQILRLLLFYGVFTPVLTLNMLFVWSYFFQPHSTQLELHTFWAVVPFWLQIILLAPICGMLVLLGRIRFLVPLPGERVFPPAPPSPITLPEPSSPATEVSPELKLPAEKELH